VRAKQPILIFTKAWNQDLGQCARYGWEKPSVTKKRPAYVDLSDDEDSDNELIGHTGKSKDGANKGEGTSGSPVLPPLSKHPRLS